MSIHAFFMPGWDKYSTWGEDRGFLYAQLYMNEDDRDAPPRIWITDPRYQIFTFEELAEVVAREVSRYEVVTIPAEVAKMYMNKGRK